MIEPDIAAYGSSASRSLLADFLELAAWAGQAPGRSHLADYIDDAELTVLSGERYITPELGNPSLSRDPEDVADQVFGLIESRATILGALYPFEVDQHGKLRRVGGDPGLYVVLLALTTIHSYAIQVTVDVESRFAEIVSDCVSALGIPSVAFHVVRDGRTFDEAVVEAGVILKASTTPQLAQRSRNANDAGVDVVAAHSWGDDRPSYWGFVGQATCGKSDSWLKKAKEASPSTWGLILNTGVSPLSFLAVPHHVEPEHMKWIVQDSMALVLDRLRLCLCSMTNLSAVDASLVEAIEAAGVATIV